MTAFRPCAIVLLAMAGTVAGSAQDQPGERPVEGGGAIKLTKQLVETGLYLISGGGGNSLLRLSANGLIIVDANRAGNYDALRKQVRRISDQSVRLLIPTSNQDDPTGINAKFLEAGTAILAHKNSADNPGANVPPPTQTYDHDYTVRLGGIEAQLLHFGNAHTSGDTVVYFPNLKVVAVGDLFGPTPNPDFTAGGSLVGWGLVLAQILKLDFDVVVPGTGPMVARADLEAFKTKVDTLVSRAAGLVRKGVRQDQLMARLKTDDLGWRFAFSGGQLDRFYAELSRTK
jgi:cyclase